MRPTRLFIAAFVLTAASPTFIHVKADAQTYFAEESQASLIDSPPRSSLSKRGTVYVPAYSSIFVDSRSGRISLATTLTIHNTSAQLSLVLERIDYFDSAGNPLHQFINAPVSLRPYATIAILVPKEIENGGIGANFTVSWAASASMSAPVVEAIMTGRLGTNSYSFVSPGRAIEPVGPGEKVD